MTASFLNASVMGLSMITSALAIINSSLLSFAMTAAEQALEDARRAGIDLDLLDTNLALSVKERWQ